MSGVLVEKTRGFWEQSVKLSVNEKLLVCGKGLFFQLMQSQPIKKSFFQRTTTPILHYTKANEQSRFLSATTYCELAVHLLFFEKYQSCVCTTVILSHRFKAFSSAFCRQNRFRNEPPENFAEFFRQSFESSPESRGSQTSGVLLVLFVHAKSTKNVPFAGSFEV